MGIGVIGVAAAHPAIGSRLWQTFGPASVWLRAGLPLMLVPPIAAPLTAELPSATTAIAAAAGLVITMVATGRIILAASRWGCAKNSVLLSSVALNPVPPPSWHATSSARLMQSRWAAACALMVGTVGTAFALRSSKDGLDDPRAVAPAFVGITTALYVASATCIPERLRLALPPTVIAGSSIIVLVLGAAFCKHGKVQSTTVRAEARRYMEGAGASLMLPVPPALATLGLMTYTHRALLVARLGPVLVATAVATPVCLLCTAAVGRWALGLQPAEVASVCPGTTTTGLALTMHGEAFPTARPEWLAIGPTICGLGGMMSWPVLLALGGLSASAAPPWVRGFAVGSASHVAGMAALAAAGQTIASEWAAVALFLCGTFRCMLLQLSPFRTLLCRTSGDSGSGRVDK